MSINYNVTVLPKSTYIFLVFICTWRPTQPFIGYCYDSESLSMIVLTSSNALLDNTELKALTLWYFCWIWPPTNSKMGVSRVDRKPSTWLSSCQKNMKWSMIHWEEHLFKVIITVNDIILKAERVWSVCTRCIIALLYILYLAFSYCVLLSRNKIYSTLYWYFCPIQRKHLMSNEMMSMSNEKLNTKVYTYYTMCVLLNSIRR